MEGLRSLTVASVKPDVPADRDTILRVNLHPQLGKGSEFILGEFKFHGELRFDFGFGLSFGRGRIFGPRRIKSFKECVFSRAHIAVVNRVAVGTLPHFDA